MVNLLLVRISLGLIMVTLMSVPLAASPKKPQQTTIPSTFLLKPVIATVVRGGDAELVIQIVAPYGGEGKFEISRQPSFGTLYACERVDSNTQRYRYANRGELYSQTDSFDFRVKAPNHAWSTYSAKIIVRDVPPSIVVRPETLLFGQIAINSSNRMEVLLSNSYGAPLLGRLQVPQPWSVLGSDSVSLKQNESCQLTIQFAPVDARSYAGQLKMIPENSAMPLVLISGQGLAPFEIVSNNLILTPDHPEAVITVSNRISNPLTISWLGNPALDYPEPVTIPPMGIANLKTTMTRVRLADDERRDFQTRLLAGRYSETVGVVASGPKGRVILEPLSKGGQLTVVAGHPFIFEGIIRNTSASIHNVELILSNPKDSNSRLVSQSINVKEHSAVPYSLFWKTMNPQPKNLKLWIREGDKDIASCTWNVVYGKTQSTNKESVDSNSATVNEIPEVPNVRFATSSECENIVILQPPHFEDGWLGRRLVLCWLYYGNSDPGFVIREHVGGSALTNRTGEDENPWRKLDSLSKQVKVDARRIWQVALPLPMPGIHQYMVTTGSSGENLVASQSVQISWKMFLWPYLRILLLIAVALIVIKAIRERI